MKWDETTQTTDVVEAMEFAARLGYGPELLESVWTAFVYAKESRTEAEWELATIAESDGDLIKLTAEMWHLREELIAAGRWPFVPPDRI